MDSDYLISIIALVGAVTFYALSAVVRHALASVQDGGIGAKAAETSHLSEATKRLLCHPRLLKGLGQVLYGPQLAILLFCFLGLVSRISNVHWITLASAMVLSGGVLAFIDWQLARWARSMRVEILRLTAPVVLFVFGMQTGTNEIEKTSLGVPGQRTQPVISLPAQEDLTRHEARMIRAILGLEKVTAREVMVPRVDMVAIEVNTPLGEAAKINLHGAHSRIPVYQGRLDNIIGILHWQAVLAYLDGPRDLSDVRSVMREPLFIPENKQLDELLLEFQEKRVQMAIVVDEYGGTEGLVTVEDVLEEIVGEIGDEFDEEEEEIAHIGPGEISADARLPLDRLGEVFGLEIKRDRVDTLGGLVYANLGRIPSPGDEIQVEGLRIRVLCLRGHRITRLQVSSRQMDLETPREDEILD